MPYAPRTIAAPRSVHSPEYQLLARHLKEVRLNPKNGGRKFTQEEVAARLGKPRSSTFKVESAEREVNVLELADYCEALEVDFFEFMQKVSQDVRSLKEIASSIDMANE